MKRIITLCFVLFNFILLAQAPVADFSANQTTICQGGSVQFTNLSTNATSYAWSFPGGIPGSSTNVNPSVIYPLVGSYTVVLTSSNGSQSDTEIKIVYVTVIANATVNLTSGIGSDNQTVCVNNPISTIQYAVTGASGMTLTGSLPAGVSGNFVASPTGGVYSISGTPTVAGTYNFVLTSTGGGCAGQVVLGSITVQNAPTLVLTSALGTNIQNICNGLPSIPIVYTFGGGAAGVNVIGLPPGMSATTVGNLVTISGIPLASGIYNYTITTVGSACTEVQLQGTIQVNPTIVLSSAVGTDNQTVCQGSPIVNLKYTVGAGATGATALGLPAGLSQSFAFPELTISGSPVVPGVYNFNVSTTGGSCPPLLLPVSITVNANHGLTLSSAPATTAQSVCKGSAISPILYALSGGATSATVTGLPAGIVANVLAGVLTISGSSNSVGTFNYTVQTTGNACTNASSVGSITITDNLSATLLSAPGTDAQLVCQNSPITLIKYGLLGGATSAVVTGLPVGVTYSLSGSELNISGTPTVAGLYNYSVTLSGGACPNVIVNGIIRVDLPNTLTLTSLPGSDNQVICEGSAIGNIVYVASGGATGAVLVAGAPAWLNATGVGGIITLSGTPPAPGVYNYSVSTSGGTCLAEVKSGTIIVDAEPVLDLTSALGSDLQTICVNTPITPISFALSGGGTGLTTSALPNALSSSVVGNVITISGAVVNAGNYSIDVLSTGGACPAATKSVNLVVQDMEDLQLSSAAGTDNQIICVGSPIANLSYVFSGGSTSAVASPLPIGTIQTVIGNTLTISGIPANSGLYPIVITSSGSACPDIVLNATLEVQDGPTLNLTSAAGTTSQSICQDSLITPIVYTMGGNADTLTVTGLPAGINAVFNAGVLTISGASSVAGNFIYIVTSSGGACSATIQAGSIDILNAASIALNTSITDTQVVCVNSMIAPIIYVIGGSATGAIATGLPTGVVLSNVANVYTISGSPAVSGVFDFSIITSGPNCVPDTARGQITSVEAPSLNLVSAPATVSQVICLNDAITNIDYTIAGGSMTFSSVGLPAGVVATQTGNSIQLAGTPSSAGIYNYVLTANGGACPDQITAGIITVVAQPILSLTSALTTDTQEVCVNTSIVAITYQLFGSASGVNAIGLPAGVVLSNIANVYTISGAPTVYGIYDYSIITNGPICGSDTIRGQITSVEAPSLNLVSAPATVSQVICLNDAITNIDYTIAGGSMTFSSVGLPAGVLATQTGNSIQLAGTPSSAGIYNYVLTANGGACPDQITAGIITVVAQPILSLTSALTTDTQEVCVNTAMVSITYALLGSATGVTATSLPSGVTSDFTAGVLTISGSPTQVGVYPYTLLPTGGLCSGIPVSGLIEVISTQIDLNSLPSTDNQIVCFGDAIDTIKYLVFGTPTLSGLPSGVSYSLTPGLPSLIKIFGVPVASGDYPFSIDITNSCGSNSVVGTITMAPSLVSNTSGVDQLICESSIFNLIGGVLPSTSLPIIYLWQSGPSANGPFMNAPIPNSLMDYSGSINLGDPNRFFRRIGVIGNCKDTASAIEVILDTLPTIKSIATDVICSNDTLILSNIDIANGVLGSWIFNGQGQFLNGNTPTPTYIPGSLDAGKTLNIGFTLLSNNSCAPKSVDSIYVIQVLADPSAHTVGSVEVCAYGAVVELKGLVFNGDLSWVHNGAGILNNANQAIAEYISTPADAGQVVKVYITAQNPLCLNPLIDSALFSINVKADSYDPNIKAFAGADTTILKGNSHFLIGTGFGVRDWMWSPALSLDDSTIYNPICSPEVSTIYELFVISEKGCYDRDSVLITVVENDDVFIPNLFSPNGDGVNDNFEIPDLDMYPGTKLTIINREGVVVYSNDNYKNEWNGTFKGDKLPEATYYYLVEFGGSEKVLKGAITILRNENK
ncbi:MAG: gliding motility-associated C-terminal domain-containing protein [Bacteroidetes bacterium]|nr:gliding motility-associated C-terminal domain-containing protein [Bacteroidota bacterium]